MSKKEKKIRRKITGKIISAVDNREVLDDAEAFWRLRGYPNRSAYIEDAIKKLNYPED